MTTKRNGLFWLKLMGGIIALVVTGFGTSWSIMSYAFEPKTKAIEHKGEFNTHKAEAKAKFEFQDKINDRMHQSEQRLYRAVETINENIRLMAPPPTRRRMERIELPEE